jgi:hypothetical protein
MLLQGTTDPINLKTVIQWGHFKIDTKNYKASSEDAMAAAIKVIVPLFAQARTTGIMKQYKELILSNNDDIKMLFFDAQHLQILAYMQNIYGKGNSFAYDPKAKGGMLQAGGMSWALVKLGMYTNPTGEELVMTRYGVLKGIFDALTDLEKNPSAKQNPGYQSFCTTLKSELIKAIKISARQNLLLIEPKIQDHTVTDLNSAKNMQMFVGSVQVLKQFFLK